MAQEMPLVEQLAAVATLGTRRAPLPKELAWPHASLAPLGSNAAAPETTLLRASPEALCGTCTMSVCDSALNSSPAM